MRALVTLGTEHEKPAEIFDLFVALRVPGLPPSLMSTPRPAMLVAIVTRSFAARLRDDLPFPLVIFRVENFVRNSLLRKMHAEQLVFFHRDGADKNRLPFFVQLFYFACDRTHFALFVWKMRSS
jgi:hypothetical protein